MSDDLNEAPEWRDVPGYEGVYAISDRGEIMRVKAGHGTHVGRILKQRFNRVTGYFQVDLYAKGQKAFSVHRLVATAFHGEPADGQMVRHLNGDSKDNRAENLAWGTASENEQDAVRHGTHYSHFRSVSHCVHGHPFDEANTGVQKGGRKCRACVRRRTAEYRARLKAAEMESK